LALIILAHRGWWLSPPDKNSRAALKRAFDAGYGVETDLRDRDGTVVVSHDPPRAGDDLMTLDDLLQMYLAAGQPGELALNVKADGLQAAAEAALKASGVDRYFFFDMAVPDAVLYLRRGLTSYTRLSEHERPPSFLDQAAGVWVDAFDGDWAGADDLLPLALQGKDLALVSPELHGRPHLETWARWRDTLPAPVKARLRLCTDLPQDAEQYFAAFGD
jgi:glycerophosphoryl diester phosphodiesterase